MTTYIAPSPRTPVLNSPASRATRWAPLALVAVVMLAALLFPELAFAEDAKAKIAATGKKAFDLVFSVVYWLCAIAVVGGGVGAMMGRMEWGRFGQIVAGIVVVFSATMMVDYFQ